MITALDLRNQLRRLGYQVDALAKSGEEAIRLSQELNPDLVLMDVNLAGAMDGLEASRQIQAIRHIPVVYLTAFPKIIMRSPAEMQRPYLCLSKPVSIPDLEFVLGLALPA